MVALSLWVGYQTYDRSLTKDPRPAPGYSLNQDGGTLLPLERRLAKLSGALGLAATDPVLTAARQVAARPGLAASAWRDAVALPCATESTWERFGGSPDPTGALIHAAYGRTADAADRLNAESATAGLTAPRQQLQALCVAVLSSPELVAQ
jgi:hypothetical protein